MSCYQEVVLGSWFVPDTAIFVISQTDKAAFIRQELRVPGVFGFLQEMLSIHPRMTKRVIAIEDYCGATTGSSTTSSDVERVVEGA